METKRTQELPFVIMEDGNKYVEVFERIKFLAENYVYEIHTEEMFFEDVNSWKVKATLLIHDGDITLMYNGTAFEKVNSSQVNKTSALENAETSAVGRAIAMAGIGIASGIASADEIKAVKRRQFLSADESFMESKKGAKMVENNVIERLKELQEKKNK